MPTRKGVFSWKTSLREPEFESVGGAPRMRMRGSIDRKDDLMIDDQARAAFKTFCNHII